MAADNPNTYYPTAPAEWYYHLFPLESAESPVVHLEWLARLAHSLLDRAEATGDEAHFGPVMHWAHLLKYEQGAEGDWPAAVDARSGDAVGTERTRVPGALLARLGSALDSTEFEAAVALAALPPER